MLCQMTLFGRTASFFQVEIPGSYVCISKCECKVSLQDILLASNISEILIWLEGSDKCQCAMMHTYVHIKYSTEHISQVRQMGDL